MNLDKLEKAASAATKGNWTTFSKRSTFAILLDGDAQSPIIEWNGFDSSRTPIKEQRANAKFIALAQPSVVLEMIELIKQLEAKGHNFY